ncbi:interleukin-18-binding protein isoform X3 [Arvicola amphibius]|uniref:interleukin-18-binding protein isoform X3 n=1 Tax=Arvicola amphibius TaxID=1047088 RepID=UPI0018E34912|nr:interleukin-18-binding protein isoform X3 [Arvicola amphibius]
MGWLNSTLRFQRKLQTPGLLASDTVIMTLRHCWTTDGTLTLSCAACSRFPYLSILYWLGNGSFIEHLPGRLREGHTSREHRNTSTWLQRALVLEELSPTLRSTNFSCLFVDPGQVAQNHIVLAQLWDGLKTVLTPSQEILSSHSPGPTSAGPGVSMQPAAAWP